MELCHDHNNYLFVRKFYRKILELIQEVSTRSEDGFLRAGLSMNFVTKILIDDDDVVVSSSLF